MVLYQQLYAFGLTLVIGMILGLLYEYYGQFRKAWGLSARATNIGDFLFWVTAALVAYLLLLQVNMGEMRFYVLISLSLGAALYFQIVAKTARPLVAAQFRLLRRLLRVDS
jgi:spore cortex biosynthesis protein YabQ